LKEPGQSISNMVRAIKY